MSTAVTNAPCRLQLLGDPGRAREQVDGVVARATGGEGGDCLHEAAFRAEVLDHDRSSGMIVPPDIDRRHGSKVSPGNGHPPLTIDPVSMRVRWERYGRPAAEALRSEISAAKANEPLAPVCIVVPSNYVGVATRRLLASGALGPVCDHGIGVAAVSFLTVYRLAELLGSLAPGRRRPTSRLNARDRGGTACRVGAGPRDLSRRRFPLGHRDGAHRGISGAPRPLRLGARLTGEDEHPCR